MQGLGEELHQESPTGCGGRRASLPLLTLPLLPSGCLGELPGVTDNSRGEGAPGCGRAGGRGWGGEPCRKHRGLLQTSSGSWRDGGRLASLLLFLSTLAHLGSRGHIPGSSCPGVRAEPGPQLQRKGHGPDAPWPLSSERHLSVPVGPCEGPSLGGGRAVPGWELGSCLWPTWCSEWPGRGPCGVPDTWGCQRVGSAGM